MSMENRVFVFNMREQPLMPCSPRKARILLKEKKAKIVNYNPFTIQLNYPTGENKQDVHIGVDTGAKHIGIAITSEDKVLYKAEVELRQDVKANLESRRRNRRTRRNRKTRYRKARILNRRRKVKDIQSGQNDKLHEVKKSKCGRKQRNGWLPPSLQNRINHTFRWIDKFSSLIPDPTIHIEVGKFDTAKMINPDIKGVDYQHGQTYGFYDERYYVFARDNYTCQVCEKSKDKILQTHHIIYRSSGGTDRVDNLITVCTDCHTSKNHKPGGILYKWQKEHKKVKQYKEPPFMNSLRLRIMDRYKGKAYITYGSETTPRRKELGLEKTHYNDAIAISGINTINENPDSWILFRQFRKKKRSLHEETARKGRTVKGKKNPNREQKRNKKNTPSKKGYYINDKVSVFGKTGYITGFTGDSAYVVDSDGNYIKRADRDYKQISLSTLKLVSHNNNWQHIRKTG